MTTLDRWRIKLDAWLDRNTEAPTITPSFPAHEGRPYRLHSFLRSGRLDLCGDSTVVPIPGWIMLGH